MAEELKEVENPGVKEEIQISRKSLYITLILIAILIFSAGSWLYIYKINNQNPIINNQNNQTLAPTANHSASEIQYYKSSIYNSLVCQFSCPITPVTIQNQTQITPDPSCTKVCENNLKATNLKNDTFTDNELITDNLFADIDQAMTKCKNQSIFNRTINYSLYYPCNLKAIQTLKSNYTYLK